MHSPVIWHWIVVLAVSAALKAPLYWLGVRLTYWIGLGRPVGAFTGVPFAGLFALYFIAFAQWPIPVKSLPGGKT